MADQENIPGISKPSVNDVDVILRELRDFSDARRQNAALELGRLKEIKAVEPLIGRLANDKSPLVREASAQALFEIGDARGWNPIKISLINDSSPDVRANAADLLGNLGIIDYAHDLVGALRDRDEKVCKQAATAIGKLKNPEVINNLIAGLSDGSDSYSGSGAFILALAQMGSMVADALFESAKNLRNNLPGYYEIGGEYQLHGHSYEAGYSFFYGPFYQDRISVISGIGKDIFNVIANYCDTKKHVAIRVVAIRALGTIDDPRSTQLLCSQAVNDPNPGIRWLAMVGIEKREDDIVASTLIRILRDDKDWILRRKAAEILGFQKEQKAVDALCRSALTDSEPRVRKEVVNSLGKIGDTNAVKTLCTVVLKDEKEIRTRTLYALGVLREPVAIPTLAELILNYPDSEIRYQTAQALGAIGSPAGIEFLLSGLGSDGNENVRVACAIALGKIGDPTPLAQLNFIADGNDPSLSVIDAAKTAKKEISEKNNSWG